MVTASGPARVLAIGAHPDDVEIGCGGTLLRHRDEGDALMVLTLSHGGNGGDPARRANEARQSATIMGAELSLHDLPDGDFPLNNRLVRMIEDAVAHFSPTHVYTHCERDTHQDHRAVCAASIVAARGVPNLLCYQSPSTPPEYAPNVYCDIAATLDGKLALIDCYRSQTERRDNLDADFIRATARYWGRFAGGGLAEPFRLIHARR